MLSPSVLWGLRLGRTAWDETGLPKNNDFSSIGHFNLVTGVSSGSWGDQWYAESRQNELSTDVTWFVDGAGSHDLKAGLSGGDPRFINNWCLNGSGQRCTEGVEGFSFIDFADADGTSIPNRMRVNKAEGPLNYGGEFLAAYFQDSWRLRSNVNLKVGLRWDRVRYDNETGQIADLSKLQPRVGMAWDIGGNGRSLLRASWGRFMHPGTTILARLTNEISHPMEHWLSCSLFDLADPEKCSALAGAYGFGYRHDPEGWDPAGWFLVPENVLADQPSQTVDDLRPGYAEEWLVGFEHELSRRTSIEVTYVNKTSRDGFDDTCNGNHPVPTPDSECDYYVVANLSEVKWDYEGLILRFETRAQDNLHLLASWVISESKGSIDANTSATGAFDFYPNHFVNRYGHLADHSRHRVKLSGYWLLPYDFAVAVDGWWDSEFRWTPYDRTVEGMPYGEVFVEPRGSGKGGSRHQLDLQFTKGFRVGPTRLVLLGTVINATDSQTADWICGSVTGCAQSDFGDAIGWQQPRRYEVGLRVEF
jgi:outer membrane receptor protein involved in Fe transport